MSVSTACPPAEDLAATVEGTASTAQRASVLEHLAGCQDCYLAFTETLRFVDPASVAMGGGARAGRGRSMRVFLPLAAAAALLLGLLWLARPPTPGTVQVATGPSSPAPVVTPSGGTPAVVPHHPPDGVPPVQQRDLRPAWLATASWYASAGAQAFAPSAANRRALLLGVHAAALSEACRSNEPALRHAVAQELAGSLGRMALLDSAAVRRTTAEVSAGRCTLDAIAVPAPVRAWFDLGRAAEAWRIAAAQRYSDAFLPARASELARLARTAGAGEAIEQMVSRLSSSSAGPHDWERLQADLAELVEALCA